MRTYAILLSWLLVPVLAWSQELVQPITPEDLTADIPALTTGLENSENVLSGNITVTSIFDDNINGTSSDRVSGMQYLIAPGINFRETRPSVSWNVQYTGGLWISNQASLNTPSDQFNQTFSGALNYTPAERLHLRIRQDYMRSSDPFDVVQSSLPGLGVLNSPNRTLVTPMETMTFMTSTGGVDYDLGENSKIGASGTFNKSDYNGTATDVNSAQTASGSVYYSRQMSRQFTIGVQYTFSDIATAVVGYQDRVLTHSVTYFQTIRIGGHSSLMLFAGPELNHQHITFSPDSSLSTALDINHVHIIFSPDSSSIPPFQSGWGPVFGGIYGWTDQRSAFGVNVVRRITDGGGVTSATTMTSGTMTASRQLSSRWTAQANMTLANNNPLVQIPTQGAWQSLIAGVDIDRRFGENVMASLSYYRICERGNGELVAVGNQNRIQLSLRYSFSKMMGN